ncbi:MAG TPA: hypothetical protein IAC79_01415 [Candidatus Spyradenecus faecavium]|uniref:Uncharacterized protein n=1 Tax=Candidatus Spyradenecus faecavium TaxID=2840947 RepID=A0A9D1T2Y6_9BACT|nr:hypothetical protein [Candidatus Spyradenecus faecavium]
MDPNEDEDPILDPIDPAEDGEEETADDPAEDSPEGEPDPDAAEDEPTREDEPEDPEADDEDDGDKDGDLPQGVRKRLAKVTAKRRAAEARAKAAEEEAARLRDRAEDPALYRALAERHGILPDLIGDRDAKALRDLDDATRSADALQDLLEEMEDNGDSEADVGGKTVTRAQLRKSIREHRRRADDLRERCGDLGQRLRRRTLKLIKLGLAAEQAQAKRPAKAPKAKANQDPRPAKRRGADPLGEPRAPRAESSEDRLNRLILAGIHARRG